ncbi:FAD:protein FMN transferase [Paraglaciecola aquimarina]|uniref:FAD:protein FMN transferase n=2 Tax=Paraglaciecola algarum TaxID=3050085 RepID=A0ABS9D7X7_9ALTE|nr:FAD:protein FMN transferase [Paraglaciecola sp. G1-23]MCF2949051.1 FAD:protein FMN transferase [Paraglaciecola sp. G1-23]
MFSCGRDEKEIHLTGPTMGTVYNIKYVDTDLITANELQKLVDTELLNINQLMSTYIKDSELSRFNQWNSTEPFPLSNATLFVMQEAKRLGELSSGLLDVTVGPLVNLWGFGPEARPEKIPSDADIIAARERVGLNRLKLNVTSARKTHPNLYVDLSTIAKGYGVDRLAEILQQYNIHNFLVEVGGEMRLSGKKSNGQDWRVAIEKPLTKERAVERIISVGNNAIATSGDYRNYYEENGIRYSHLIDPTTAYPINHNLVSVTVVHSSSMTADGLATALNVMGKERALALANKNDLAVFLITRENDDFKEYTSTKFEQVVTVH